MATKIGEFRKKIGQNYSASTRDITKLLAPSRGFLWSADLTV